MINIIQLCNRNAKYIMKKRSSTIIFMCWRMSVSVRKQEREGDKRIGHGDIQKYNKYSCFCYSVREGMASRPWSGWMGEKPVANPSAFGLCIWKNAQNWGEDCSRVKTSGTNQAINDALGRYSLLLFFCG